MNMFMEFDIVLATALLFGVLSLLISLIAIGLLDLLSRKRIDLNLSISYAAGIFIGLIFIDLFPEIVEYGDPSLSHICHGRIPLLLRLRVGYGLS